MELFTFLATLQKDGKEIEMNDFLSVIPDNDWLWCILEFDGTEKPSYNIGFLSLDLSSHSSKNGVIVSWSDIKIISEAIDQMFNCLIVAAKSTAGLAGDKAEMESYTLCEIAIEAIDGGEWSVLVKDADIAQKLSCLGFS